MVERYSPAHENWGRIPMEPGDKGDWVRFSDYADLERQLAEMRAERDALVLSTGAHITARSEYLARAEAAEAERDRLAAENERLREALEPFANWAKKNDAPNYDGAPPAEDEDHPNIFQQVTFGDFRRARAALDTAKGAEK